MATKKDKDRLVTLKLTEEDAIKLDRIRDEHCINISSFLRKTILDKYNELYPKDNGE